MLKFIVCFQMGKKVKVLGGGDVLDMLVFATAICGTVAEKIAKEKNMSNHDAVKLVLDSISEGYDKLKE